MRTGRRDKSKVAFIIVARLQQISCTTESSNCYSLSLKNKYSSSSKWWIEILENTLHNFLSMKPNCQVVELTKLTKSATRNISLTWFDPSQLRKCFETRMTVILYFFWFFWGWIFIPEILSNDCQSYHVLYQSSKEH